MIGDLTRETVYISGPRAELVGELCYTDTRADAAVVIANPHPLMGGAINNNVVERMALGLPELGFVTLRFDYAGVGHSGGEPIDVAEHMQQFWDTGSTAADPRMCEEARCATDWLGDQFGLPVLGVGYSFGAYALSSTAADQLDAIAVISPTLTRHDFTTLTTSALPVLVVYTDNDFATPVEDTRAWIDSLGARATGHLIAAGDHFYRDRERQILDVCAGFFKEVLKHRGQK